jgi:hypothetical protein
MLRPSYIRGLVEHVEPIWAFEALTTVYSFGICSYGLTRQAWVSFFHHFSSTYAKQAKARLLLSRSHQLYSLSNQPHSSSFVELICFVRGTQSQTQAFTMPKRILRAN